MFELPAAIPVAIGPLDALIVVAYLAAHDVAGHLAGSRAEEQSRLFSGRASAADVVAAALDRGDGNEHGHVFERAGHVVRRRTATSRFCNSRSATLSAGWRSSCFCCPGIFAAKC